MSQNQQQSDRLIWQIPGVEFLLYCLCSNTFNFFILAVGEGSW
ncbi:MULTISPECIES: hypothetical protein [unclassified Microcoleus]|jgi:hypothetical protein|nr:MULTISPECIES: hypothetical protein [unclassified Microcoleus]